MNSWPHPHALPRAVSARPGMKSDTPWLPANRADMNRVVAKWSLPEPLGWIFGLNASRLENNGLVATDEPYYRHDLAYVHDRGYGFHADLCAPGILALLEPVRDSHGVVLE